MVATISFRSSIHGSGGWAWLPGRCTGTTPILVLGPRPQRGQTRLDIPSVVTTHQTAYGDVTHIQLPLVVYSAALALVYHPLGDFNALGGALRGPWQSSEAVRRKPPGSRLSTFMATLGWVVVLPACEQPVNNLPSDA